MRPLLSTALVFALLVPAQRAAAQPAPTGADVAVQVTVGKALLTEGQKLMETGRMAEARDKLEASVRHDPSLPALLLLADCQARLGATASAWGNFHRAEERARILGDKAAAEEAVKRAAALEPGLTRVRFEVETGGASAAISLDGQPLPESAWGTAIPIDPGRHKVTAFVGQRAFSKEFELPADGATTVIRIPGSSVKPTTRVLAPARAPQAASDYSQGVSTGTVVLLSLGGVGIVSGIVGAAMLMSEGRKSQGVFTAGVTLLVAGGVLILPAGIGAIIGLVEKNRTKTVQTPLPLRVSPMVAQGGGGLSLQMDF